ncbi:TetR/AcrR family transcriptional regulator [Reichenbachiella ulvae]|uniref:TetR/AcrR family transcriptional regulator n=1 Tax=Reichenbachiella ulvae TaxID=2980104 RepID=A0ABT3CS04_9BACT|nr:TetR/AcrR family transcriptional regulator [Reichenbachiella ulvae]MCV9386457.1 TetR/AcrR family transcriptional regulator [Reichenbachiella ulvae]
MGKREETVQNILQTATDILLKEGQGQMSMRRVAKEANITLSNLQYYFKDQSSLLIAMIEAYFNWCLSEVKENLNKQPENFKQFLEDILNDHLIEGGKTAQCSMFKEIWALTTRDPQINDAVHTYYKKYCQEVIAVIADHSSRPEQLVSLILPYVEGYSIMGTSIPLNKSETIQMLVQIIMGIEAKN